MRAHLHRWGVVYILLAGGLVFTAIHATLQAAEAAQQAAWHGQGHTTADGVRSWARTAAENLQSEFWQLLVQAALVIGASSVLFRKSQESVERLHRKVDELLRREDEGG